MPNGPTSAAKARDGSVIDTTWAVTRLSDGTSVSIGQNISERKRAEAERRQLLQRLITAQEDERRHLSRELHDNIGQYLSALLLGLESVAQRAGPADSRSQPVVVPERNNEAIRAGRTQRGAGVAADDARRSRIGSRRCRALRANGPSGTIRRIKVVFNSRRVSNLNERLPFDIEVAIYRVVQEALTNASRHSNAEDRQHHSRSATTIRCE